MPEMRVGAPMTHICDALHGLAVLTAAVVVVAVHAVTYWTQGEK